MKPHPAAPRLIAFEITRRCRFNCRHCRAAASTDTNFELSTQDCLHILKSIADYNKCVVIFTGGEPMERPDVYELVESACGLGLRVVLASCGYCITDSSIVELKRAGLLAISFSLDGSSPQTHDSFRRTPGAFDTVLKAAELARRNGIRFQINTTVTKSNLGEIPALASLAETLGAYCFNPFILIPTGRGKEITDQLLSPDEYEKLLNELANLKLNTSINLRLTCGPQFARVWRQFAPGQKSQKVSGCLAARDFAFISYRGDVQTCGFLNISAGNLLENNFNFAQIWQESELLNDIRDLSKYKGSCRGCEYLSLCRGCRARAFASTGDYLADDPICEYKTGVMKWPR